MPKPVAVNNDYCLIEYYNGDVKHDMKYACICEFKKLPADAAKECKP